MLQNVPLDVLVGRIIYAQMERNAMQAHLVSTVKKIIIVDYRRLMQVNVARHAQTNQMMNVPTENLALKIYHIVIRESQARFSVISPCLMHKNVYQVVNALAE